MLHFLEFRMERGLMSQLKDPAPSILVWRIRYMSIKRVRQSEEVSLHVLGTVQSKQSVRFMRTFLVTIRHA